MSSVTGARPVAAGPAEDAGASVPDRPAYLYLVLAGIVFNIFSGNSRYLGLPIGLDRICFTLGIALLVLDRRAWSGLRLLLRPVHLLILGTLAVTVWSALAHDTLVESYGFYALLDRLAVPYLFFVLAPVIFRTAHRRDLLLRTLVLLGVYLGVLAVLQMVGGRALIFPRYINDPSLGLQFGRARGPFLESVANGLVLAACGFAAGFAVSRWSGRWRLVALASTVLCALGCLLTLTRSIWVGAAAGVLLVCAADPRLRRFLPVLAVAGVIGVLGALAVIPGLRESVTSRAGNERSVYDRQNTNAAALRIVDRFPLEGVGWVRFRLVAADYVRQAPDYPITNINLEVHNVPLGRAAELGLPGALLWVGSLLAGPGAALVRHRGSSPELAGWRLVLIGTGTAWFAAAMLTPLPYALPNLLLWLLAGIVAAPGLVREEVSG